MINWFADNGGTLLVGLILLVIVTLAVRKLISDKKQGRSTCSCGCGGCPMSGTCHQQRKPS